MKFIIDHIKEQAPQLAENGHPVLVVTDRVNYLTQGLWFTVVTLNIWNQLIQFYWHYFEAVTDFWKPHPDKIPEHVVVVWILFPEFALGHGLKIYFRMPSINNCKCGQGVLECGHSRTRKCSLEYTCQI